MAQGKSSVGFWVLIGTLLVGGGIGAYFLLRKPKEEKEGEEEVATDDSSSSSSSSSNSSSSQYVASTPSPSAPAELDSTEKITAFQNYVLTTIKDTTILGKSGADGLWGKNSQKAWDKYGKDYLKKTPTSQPSAGSSNKNIDIIIKKASGDLTERSKLATRPAQFLQDWATALTNNRSAFRYANQIYRADTGVKVLEWNPINATIYANQDVWSYDDKFANAQRVRYTKGKKIGKVTDYAFQYNRLMLYVPEISNYKWFKAKEVTKTKPKSSFDGNNAIEFSSFDNNLDLNL